LCLLARLEAARHARPGEGLHRVKPLVLTDDDPEAEAVETAS
jgi:hypothetical protein